MPDTQQLWMFVVAGVLLNLTPGPDVLFIVSQSLRGGVRAGVVAAWGITAGCFVHLAAAALGVGALLATSAAAFNAINWLGAAYLMWIGARLHQRGLHNLDRLAGFLFVGWGLQLALTDAPAH